MAVVPDVVPEVVPEVWLFECRLWCPVWCFVCFFGALGAGVVWLSDAGGGVWVFSVCAAKPRGRVNAARTNDAVKFFIFRLLWMRVAASLLAVRR